VASITEPETAPASTSGTEPGTRALDGYAKAIGAYLAEFVGTFTLVFAGCGAIMVDSVSHGQITHVGVAITFGLVIAAMIYATGHISGAHFNPAVTLGFALTRHFSFRRVPLYWLAQLLGAASAALLLRIMFGNVAHVGATLPSGSDGQSLVLEIILTFFLMFVVMAVATDDRAVGQAAALAVGGTVLLDAMFGGPISGASMNPARSFGPALASNMWAHYWIYVVAPIAGAIVGAFTYELVRGERPRPGLNHEGDT
jgi:MIP family channel proteins